MSMAAICRLSVRMPVCIAVRIAVCIAVRIAVRVAVRVAVCVAVCIARIIRLARSKQRDQYEEPPGHCGKNIQVQHAQDFPPHSVVLSTQRPTRHAAKQCLVRGRRAFVRS